MAKIISILLISLLGWKVTGYDFLTIASLITFAFDLYIGLKKAFRNFIKYTKDKTA